MTADYGANPRADAHGNIHQAQTDATALANRKITFGNSDLHHLIAADDQQTKDAFVKGNGEGIDMLAQIAQSINILPYASHNGFVRIRRQERLIGHSEDNRRA